MRFTSTYLLSKQSKNNKSHKNSRPMLKKVFSEEAVRTVASFNWLKHYLLESSIVGSSPTAKKSVLVILSINKL